MKNDLDFSKVFDKNGKLIGALNFNILPSIANHNNVVICRLRSSRQSHYVALAEGV